MDLWALAQGEEREGITPETIEYLLLCIMGNFHVELEVEPEAEEGEEAPAAPADLNGYGSYNDEGVFILRKGGQRKVFNHFNILFANRLVFYQNKPVKDVEAEHIQEAPVVSDKSKKLAEEARRKKLGDAADAAQNGDFVSYIYAKDRVL